MIAIRCLPCVVVLLVMTVNEVVSQPTVDGGPGCPDDVWHLVNQDEEFQRLKQSLADSRDRQAKLEKLLAEKNSTTNSGEKGPSCSLARNQTAITMNLLTRLNASSPSRVYGVATGRGEILVVGFETKTIRVYEDGGSYAFKREISISSLTVPNDIVYESKSCGCFFVADLQNNQIWKLTTSENTDQLSSWGDRVEGLATLSVPICGDGLMLVRTDPRNSTIHHVTFYSTNGTRTRNIQLPAEIQSPFHAVQTSRDTFIVSHPKVPGSSDTYSVLSQVDSYGRIINQFLPTQPRHFTSKQVHLAIDSELDVLFVADIWKSRVLAFDAKTLNWIGVVTSRPASDPLLHYPFRIAFDATKRRLLVGHWASRPVPTNPSKYGDGRLELYQVRIRKEIDL